MNFTFTLVLKLPFTTLISQNKIKVRPKLCKKQDHKVYSINISFLRFEF